MTAPTYDLGKLHGGLRLDPHKSESTALPLRTMPVPAQLILPLTQHVGEASDPIVEVGEHVHKGQLVASNGAAIGAPVHAPTSGRILAIEPWPVARRYGDPAPAIVLESDGEDRGPEHAAGSGAYDKLTPDELKAKILEGGIVGLGGAVFPTAQKLMQAGTGPLDMLILNGVECEPYISCDDMLMRERADSVVGGAKILLHALDIGLCFLVVESDKPEALQALGEALGRAADDRLILKQVPSIYPSGGEDQLVQLVTNREVPAGGLPSDVGCVVQNVGTAAAVYDWIGQGLPLISRITTVTGPGVTQPMNVLVRLGTSVADLVAFAGGYTDRAEQLIIGGAMTGKSMSTDEVPVVKACNCILVLSEAATHGPVLPCIRCGDCADVCPVRLLPQQLHWYYSADEEKPLREHGLLDCIECGCCDLVCPSNIPLTASFRRAKNRIRELEDEKARALRARMRFEARRDRLAKEEDARTLELEKQKNSAKKGGADAIAEIMRRKRDKDDPD
ncbi:MAG: electron transport complex subunit RsxC [Pseudomonadota bacterium]